MIWKKASRHGTFLSSKEEVASVNMASAPPLETAEFGGHLQPPSYEESMTPQYTHGPGLPPAYTKMAHQQYPTQVHSQAYPPAHSPISPIVSVQTIYMQPGVVYGHLPVHTHCPACAQMVVTRLEHNPGTMAWLTCAGLFIFGCIYGCCLIPFCLDGLKDVTHRCPNCSKPLGVYKRL
ncbi:lipopolysaccharide-induced tumor necrosis factor-alpha factor homolog isoform X1 [Osmerus eperlanus]|uniref:lipopolysaccharide-induced tumor necrosis factor-alpha factor homolog isoform X1 n=2 Tax=Osmerus eperlanus TaxID=29151 RepID=UPI002E155E94